jgi:hypothetical protein
LFGNVPKVYVSFCPVAADCKKGGKRLGSDADEEAARKRIVHHLTYSSYHLMSGEDAELHAQAATLQDEEVEEVDWNQASAEWQGWKGGRGGGKASGKASGDQWRSHPYADNKGSGSKGSGKASGKGSSSSYESAEIDQLTLQLAN